MEKYVDDDGKEQMRGWPFVVPGGRFNELYGNFSWHYLLSVRSLIISKQAGIVT